MDKATQIWSRFDSRLPANRLIKNLLLGSVTGSIISLALVIREDYKAFLALGPGGPPYNVFGWALVTFILRPLALSAKYTTWTGDYPATGAHQDIQALPTRKGPRAETAGLAPHRQISQNATDEMKMTMESLCTRIVCSNPTLLERKTSHYERHLPALYVHPSILNDKGSNLPPFAQAACGEIGHIHADGSTHLYFSPADAKQIILKGWGERHRLGRRTPWFIPAKERSHTFGVGFTYLLIFGPRDDRELQVFMTLLARSVAYMTGSENVVLE